MVVRSDEYGGTIPQAPLLHCTADSTKSQIAKRQAIGIAPDRTIGKREVKLLSVVDMRWMCAVQMDQSEVHVIVDGQFYGFPRQVRYVCDVLAKAD